jgi:hypothetical protein
MHFHDDVSPASLRDRLRLCSPVASNLLQSIEQVVPSGEQPVNCTMIGYTI